MAVSSKNRSVKAEETCAPILSLEGMWHQWYQCIAGLALKLAAWTFKFYSLIFVHNRPIWILPHKLKACIHWYTSYTFITCFTMSINKQCLNNFHKTERQLPYLLYAATVTLVTRQLHQQLNLAECKWLVNAMLLLGLVPRKVTYIQYNGYMYTRTDESNLKENCSVCHILKSE